MRASIPTDISDDLYELGQTIVSWNWFSFLEVLIATIVGGAIAVSSSYLLSRREKQRQREVALNDALAEIIDATEEYATANVAASREAQVNPVWLPLSNRVVAAITKGRMLANGDQEVEVLNALREAALRCGSLEEPEDRAAEITQIWPTLIRWRDGKPHTQIITELKAVAAGSRP